MRERSRSITIVKPSVRPLIRAGWIALGAGGTVLAAVSSQSATQVELTIRTNVSQSGSRIVSIQVGAGRRALESFAPVAEVRDWTVPAGDVGTLTLIPGGTNDAETAVRVVLAAEGKRPELCTDDEPQSCIIARRATRFLAHTSLRIPITLYARCFGVPCSPDRRVRARPVARSRAIRRATRRSCLTKRMSRTMQATIPRASATRAPRPATRKSIHRQPTEPPPMVRPTARTMLRRTARATQAEERPQIRSTAPTSEPAPERRRSAA